MNNKEPGYVYILTNPSKQSDGISVVCRCGKWGFYEIEQHTTTIVNDISFLGLLHNDLAKVNNGGTFSKNKVNGGKWGGVNRNGEIVINPQYDYVFNFSEGIAAVRLEDKYGFIDTAGTLIVPCEYDKVESHFKDGEGELVKGDKIYVFDKTGNVVSNRYVEKEHNDYDFSWLREWRIKCNYLKFKPEHIIVITRTYDEQLLLHKVIINNPDNYSEIDESMVDFQRVYRGVSIEEIGWYVKNKHDFATLLADQQEEIQEAQIND